MVKSQRAGLAVRGLDSEKPAYAYQQINFAARVVSAALLAKLVEMRGSRTNSTYPWHSRRVGLMRQVPPLWHNLTHHHCLRQNPSYYLRTTANAHLVHPLTPLHATYMQPGLHTMQASIPPLAGRG